MADADRCIAFMRSFAERRARRVVPFRFGRAFFDDELPLAPDLNAVSVEANGDVPAAELLAEVERLQGSLAHRLVWVDDDTLGAELAPAFVAAGLTVVTNVVMTYSGGGREVDTGAVVEVTAETLVPVWEAEIARDAKSSDEIVRQLLAAQLLRRKAVEVRYFAVCDAGAPVSYCELFSDGVMGQVESVFTLEPHRGNGYASAVVTKALEESRARGHELAFLVADERRRPRELYAKLGFEPVTRIWDFGKGDLV